MVRYMKNVETSQESNPYMQDFPHLAFLPVENLLFHERHDDQRTRPLILKIRASRLWRNPPIVTPLQDGAESYMILDGANRISALQQMGFPHALVQIVDPTHPGLGLQNWNHVVWEMNPIRFLVGASKIDNLHARPLHGLYLQPDLEGDCGLALVQSCRKRYYSLCSENHDLEKRVALLNAIVDSYKDHARMDRTGLRDVSTLHEVYPSLCGLVIFPHFKIHDLMKLAGKGYLLPAGITRFTISPRVLHLNYPLDELAANKSLEDKNTILQRWIRNRIAHKGVRFYAESTYLFDE